MMVSKNFWLVDLACLLSLLSIIVEACTDPNRVTIIGPGAGGVNATVPLGGTVHFICCHPAGADNLKWIKDSGDYIPSATGGQVVYALKDEKNRLILRIDNVTDADHGGYSCLGPNSLQAKVFLMIGPSSNLVVHSEFRMFPSDEPVEIVCPVRDSQTPVLWLYTIGGEQRPLKTVGVVDDMEVTAGLRSLRILYPQSFSLPRKVWCYFEERTQRSGLGKGYYEIEWDIYDPVRLSLSVTTGQPILEGQPVTVTCRFNRVGIRQTALWFKNGVPLGQPYRVDETELNNGEVMAKAKEAPADPVGTSFTCQVTTVVKLASKEFTVVNNASITPEMIYRPQIINTDHLSTEVKLGDHASLRCQIRGNKLARMWYEWRRTAKLPWAEVPLAGRESEQTVRQANEGIDTGVTDLIFEINSVTAADRGHYRCSATNAAGTVSHDGQLRVLWPPQLLAEPGTAYFLVQPIKVSCLVTGYPLDGRKEALRVEMKGSQQRVSLFSFDYDEFAGINATYDVQLDPSLGRQQSAYCVYTAAEEDFRSNITFHVASKPDPPKISVICRGPEGIVFGVSNPEVTPESAISNRIVQQYVVFSQAESFLNTTSHVTMTVYLGSDNQPVPRDTLTYESSQDSGSDSASAASSRTVTVSNLIPRTNYIFEWNSANKFQLSQVQLFNEKTEHLSGPVTPKKLEFTSQMGSNAVIVLVWLADPCPYFGARMEVADLLVRLRLVRPNFENDGSDNWQPTRVVRVRPGWSGKVPVRVELSSDWRPIGDFQVSIASRNRFGLSDWQTAIYRAAHEARASLLCNPHCHGNRVATATLVELFLLLVACALF